MQTATNLYYNNSLINRIEHITQAHITHLLRTKLDNKKIDLLLKALHSLLNGSYQKYRFDNHIFDKISDDEINDVVFQTFLSKINEKELIRKKNGVYYTPIDVVSFIVDNCYYKRIKEDTKIISQLDSDNDIDDLIFNDNVFDPTCGTGEFLLYAYQKKIKLLQRAITSEDLCKILETIHGNDINADSIEITKIRLFFETLKYTSESNYFSCFAKILNKNMSNQDFINININTFNKYEIILGNPPYVEDSKSCTEPEIRYGNIFANVLQNSSMLLDKKGVLGFIIPLSYVSTIRMKKIRKFMKNNFDTQYILNYADRPDCLFASVHQKLSILFAQKDVLKKEVFTSSYQYWYKTERDILFADIKLESNSFQFDDFYPKIGNYLEKSIFTKIISQKGSDILALDNIGGTKNVFLNMRACFWIKAFSFNPGSKEYKGFSFDPKIQSFVLCLLNSSLFFLFWNIVSDCWHITNKDLKNFLIPIGKKYDDCYEKLAKELEKKLELTKKYVGTKQTMYEYKHKFCKDIIDAIDDHLSTIYSLTIEETKYIKDFSSKYRESRGE